MSTKKVRIEQEDVPGNVHPLTGVVHFEGLDRGEHRLAMPIGLAPGSSVRSRLGELVVRRPRGLVTGISGHEILRRQPFEFARPHVLPLAF